MAAITHAPHKEGDFLVDYEEKVFEDVKAAPGEKALVTFHTVAVRGVDRPRQHAAGDAPDAQRLRDQRAALRPGRHAGRAARLSQARRGGVPRPPGRQPEDRRLHGRRRQGLRLPLRAAGALRPDRGGADPRHHARSTRWTCWTSCCCTARPTPSSSTPGRCRRCRDGTGTFAPRRSSSSPALGSRRAREDHRQGLRRHRGGGARGGEFIVFPETVVPYYPYFSFIQPPGGDGQGAPAPVRGGGHGARARPSTPSRTRRARRARWSCWASTSATTARSTTRSWCSTPTAGWSCTAARSRRRSTSG